MKSAALPLAVLVSVFSFWIPFVEAQTVRRTQVQSRPANVRRPAVKPGAARGGGPTYFYPARPGYGCRCYLPPTSVSSVDISVAEYDPPGWPISDTTEPPSENDGPRGTRGQ